MKPKRSPRNQFKTNPVQSSAPNVPSPVARKDGSYLTQQSLNEVAAGTEKSIRDTPAWKQAVRRLGLKEVRRRVRFACLVSQFPAATPFN